MGESFVYEYENNIYLNLTNSCSNNCSFCIRNFVDGVGKDNLWLEREPSAAEIIEILKERDLSKYGEAVFCGFGEPTERLDVLIDVAGWLKSKGMKVRLNTNGQGDLICGEDCALRLCRVVDRVNVSLNYSCAQVYQRECQSRFGEQGFFAMLNFATRCKELKMGVIFSVVDSIGAKEIEECKKLAQSLSIPLRVRETIT